MIKYKLLCNDCSQNFDSWFASSKEYEKVKKLKHLNCYNCNSFKVEKTLMSPSVLSSKDKIVTRNTICIVITKSEGPDASSTPIEILGRIF